MSEAALLPDLPIIDAHHHLRNRGGERYLAEEFADDIAQSGHHVIASVAIETGWQYDDSLGKAMAPVSETLFLASVAARHTSPVAIAAGIVGYADLSLGAAVKEVLEAHITAGGGRFSGIRTPAAWHEDARFKYARAEVSRGALLDESFRAGFAQLGTLGLIYEAWVYADQLADVIDLARSFPDTTIVVDHLGGPVSHDGPLSNDMEAFERWHANIKGLAGCRNVVMKLGGLGLPVMGFGFDGQAERTDSTVLAGAWQPFIDACIEAFTPDRCMFQSNFPPDKISCSYGALWNAFKRISSGCSPTEKEKMFAVNAARVYRMTLPKKSARTST